MASSDTQNVVVNSLSTGDASPVDAHASQSNSASASNGVNSTSSNPATQSTSDDLQEKSPSQPNGSLTAPSNSASQMQSDTSEARANGHEQGVESKSVADTASVHGSVADIDSLRDTGSVVDGNFEGIGSDTDTSRADGNEQLKDANGNIKANAAKKPASFKAVSVTKNFLAKTASVVPMAKPGEKAAAPSLTSPQTMARPRLVAKSGSGLRDTPRPRPGADGATEGTTVWNKNRPAPPAPPKHFTDEELKQQYGIHLASRIQGDETIKGAKWADIDDDDEDDWAPETVEWMDGTKSTINPEPLPAQPVKEIAPAQPRPLETRSNMTPLKRPTTTGPPKTILRPGAAQQAKQDNPNGNATPEQNATAGNKNAAPPPAKSPWATLPPVDKALPVFNPPPPPVSSRPPFGSQDARMMDSAGPTAREMEADTFDRSWRDSERPRELFNSQSGRYEPVAEGRRNSIRQEGGYRQPAVLQRPGHGDMADPALDRNQQTDSPWARRRGSSVSGPNGQAYERRVSVTKSTDTSIPAEQRTGIIIGHDIGPQAKYDSKQAQKAQQQIDDRNEEIAKQKRIMQEKRELAIRRRQEEEQKEEAERKERIRLKLESLGLPPVSEKSQAGLQSKAGTTQVKTDSSPQPPAQSSIAGTTQDNQIRDTTIVSNTSPAKAQPLANVRSDPGSKPQFSPNEQLPHSSNPAEAANQSSRIPNPGFPPRSLQDSKTSAAPVSSYSSPGEQKAQPAFKSPALVADTFATWGNRNNPTHGTPNSNVWGPPGALRHIGNGAFDAGYTRIPPRLQNQNIGPAQAAGFSGPQVTRSPSAGNRQQETSPMRHQQMLSDQNLAALGLVDTPTDSFPSAASAGPSPMPSQAQPLPLSPIAPPPRHTQVGQSHQQAPARGVAAWGQFAARAHAEHADPNVQSPPVTHPSLNAPQEQPNQQRWKETFKQTKVSGGWTGGSRSVVAEHQAARVTPQAPARVGVASPAPPVSQTQQPAAAPIATGAPNTVRLPTGPAAFSKTPGPVRPNHVVPRGPASMVAAQGSGAHQSRFFPSSAHGGSPPPEESGHPVHSGSDKNHPTVNLPRAKPNVRLPPSAVAAEQTVQHSPVIMPQRTPSFRAGAQPLVQSSDWQARFNGLFGRVNTTTATPPSPPKTPPKMAAVPSPAPLSSSKADVFDVTEPLQTTSVSLPHTPVSFTAAPIYDMAVKPTAEVMFDGELSFGSTPKVSVPCSPNYNLQPERNGVHLLKMRAVARFDKPVEPVTCRITIDFAVGKPSNVVTVHLPGEGTPTKDYNLKRDGPAAGGKTRKASAKFGKAPKIGDSRESTPGPASSPVPKNARSFSLQKVTPTASSPQPETPTSGPVTSDRQVSHSGKPPRGPKFPKARQASGKPQTAS